LESFDKDPTKQHSNFSIQVSGSGLVMKNTNRFWRLNLFAKHSLLRCFVMAES